MKQILFRASSVGNLMSASGKLTDTNKKYLTQIFVGHKYGREKKFENKYVNKGLAVEEDSLTLFSRYMFPIMYEKNETRYSNKYIAGTPDIITNDEIIDIKSSYDIFTFFESKASLNDLYYWQLQCYMALTGKKKARLAYCLTDMPDHIFNDEKRRLSWKMGSISDESPEYLQAVEQLRLMCYYDEIPLKERVHEIFVERNDSDIMALYKRIELGREYIKDTFNYG